MSQDPSRIQGEIEDILREYLHHAPPLSAATDLIADLDLESVQVMEFVVEVEDHYDIAIDLESLSNVRTLGQLAQVVAQTLE